MTRVTLRWRNRRRETIELDNEQVILDGAEANGIALPFGCRTGACASCTGRIIDGHVEHTRPPRALKSRHLDEGYILTCIARPTTPCTVEVGSGVQQDLVSNPWK